MTWLCFPSFDFLLWTNLPNYMQVMCSVLNLVYDHRIPLRFHLTVLEFILLSSEWVHFAGEHIFHSTPVPLCLSILFTDFYTEHFCSFSEKYTIWKPVLVWVFLIAKQALEFNLFPIIITSVFSFHLLSLQYPLLFSIINSLTNLFLRVL